MAFNRAFTRLRLSDMLYCPLLLLLATLPLASVVARPQCNGTAGAVFSDGTSEESSTASLVAMSWYAGWLGSDSNLPFPPENVTWSKYTRVAYAFATVTSNGSLYLHPSDEQLLPRFVQLAHQHNVSAVLTVGGWSGSRYFSSSVATPENRSALVNASVDIVSKYDLDGLDFDWEYPVTGGLTCNINSGDDSANFLSFLQLLRTSSSNHNLSLSAAVGLNPFSDPDGKPMANVSKFADILDYIEIMNFDVWGAGSSTVGPNAPLLDSCAPSAADQHGSAVSAVNAWSLAGFRNDTIILGVPGYGHTYRANDSSAVKNGSIQLYPPILDQQAPSDPWHPPSMNGEACEDSPSYDGIYNFRFLIEDGYLTGCGTPAAVSDHMWDNCSYTPYIYDVYSQVMVSYDNATSFSIKGDYITELGLAGFSMWHAGSDHDDILLDAIWDGLCHGL